MPAPAPRTEAASDPPPRHRRTWLLVASAVAPALILLSSEIIYALLGMAGMLLLLPLGALPWLLVWASLIATAILMSPLLDPLAARLETLLGLDGESRTEHPRRLSRVTWMVLCAGLLMGLGSAMHSRSSSIPVCTLNDVPERALLVISTFMGHGQLKKVRPCRSMETARPGPWIPLLLSLPLLLALHRAEDRRRQERLDKRLALLLTPAQPGSVDSGMPTQYAASAAALSTAEAAAGDLSAPAPASTETAMRPSIPLSARSQALLDARRKSGANGLQTLRGWLKDAAYRLPVLSIGLGCYLAGSLVNIAGSDLSLRIAESLTPAVVRHEFSGWPVLGLWASTLVALVGGGLITWLRRRDD